MHAKQQIVRVCDNLNDLIIQRNSHVSTTTHARSFPTINYHINKEYFTICMAIRFVKNTSLIVKSKTDVC